MRPELISLNHPSTMETWENEFLREKQEETAFEFWSNRDVN